MHPFFSKIESKLLQIQNPLQYMGGEFGMHKKKGVLKVGLSFPDLYEIGMSNLAIRLLYTLWNALEGVQCERVFAPARDFEKLLLEEDFPNFTLESQIPLFKLDILAFSINYELLITNVLSIMKSGKIAVFNQNRNNEDPIIIAGGPAVTNPFPFGQFIDVFFIGDAEPITNELFPKLVEAKRNNADRNELLQILCAHPAAWFKGIERKTIRSLWSGFSSAVQAHQLFPVPNIKIVQDHGMIEIMRGCPHGCRFCHATYFYRPLRTKSMVNIFTEAQTLVHECGYQEITLCSLSSGDYSHLSTLCGYLNQAFKDRGVSFSLPSLKISTFDNALFNQLTVVRKCGLTFAVETPRADWQKSINKSIPETEILSIIHNAAIYGWKQIKLYFMIGLPNTSPDEEQAIIDYLNALAAKVRLFLHVNIGTFVPKPHTPFQWNRQISEEESFKKINAIKRGVNPKKIKVVYHSPFQSMLEGLISRGDERVGQLIYHAFEKGCRFDAWDDQLNKELWRQTFTEYQPLIYNEILSERNKDSLLLWDNIQMLSSSAYLKKENKKAEECTETSSCTTDCEHPCGACNSQYTIPQENAFDFKSVETIIQEAEAQNTISALYSKRILLQYSKKEEAAYLSHLNLLSVLERSFIRSGISFQLTKGFNPHPKISFASPLSVGIESDCEIVLMDLQIPIDFDPMIEKLNTRLPSGIKFLKYLILKPEYETRKISLMKIYGGSCYLVQIFNQTEDLLHAVYSAVQIYINSCNLQKAVQCSIAEDGLQIFLSVNNCEQIKIRSLLQSALQDISMLNNFKIRRLQTFAQNLNKEIISYFDAFI